MLLSACTLATDTCNAQIIVAGSVGNAIYYDFAPDSILSALAVNNTPYPGETLLLDLDSDGTDDFKISTFGVGGLGGGSGDCTVKPLTPNGAVASHLDTSQGCCPSQYVVLLVDTLAFGDTISSQLDFNPGKNYIWSTTYGMEHGPRIYAWNNIGERFIGLRQTRPSDTLYCWVRVEVNTISRFNLIVKDYSCNSSSPTVIPELSPPPCIELYPNPFIETLSVTDNCYGRSELIIYDMSLRMVMQRSFSGTMELPTEQLSKGIYFYEVRNEKGTIQQGKIVRN